MENTMTREGWLLAATEILRAKIDAVGESKVPAAVYVSVGFPSRGGLSRGKRVIGQCWSVECSADGRPHVFISPVLDMPKALSTLLHELIHAAAGNACGHKGEFVRIAKAVGFSKPWTQTPTTPELDAVLADVAAQLPAYPHAQLTAQPKDKKGSRLRLWECACERPVKVRCASDTFDATCNACEAPFELRG